MEQTLVHISLEDFKLWLQEADERYYPPSNTTLSMGPCCEWFERYLGERLLDLDGIFMTPGRDRTDMESYSIRAWDNWKGVYKHFGQVSQKPLESEFAFMEDIRGYVTDTPHLTALQMAKFIS